jgi:hypothetical protein
MLSFRLTNHPRKLPFQPVFSARIFPPRGTACSSRIAPQQPKNFLFAIDRRQKF